MTPDLLLQFGTREGEERYGRAIADLIRAERHDVAESTLIADLASLRVPLADLCVETRADAIHLTGWEALQHMIFRPMRNGRLCTAVGLDLSDAATPPPTPEGSVEPGVEVSFYSDTPFPFSARTRDEILASNAKYGTPWQGSFEQMAGDCYIAVAGLARLHTAIAQLESQRVARPRPEGAAAAPPEYVAFRLAEWLRTMRYHQTVKRYLDQEGLSRRIPVLVGSNETGPFVEAVYYAAPGRESAEDAIARMVAVRDVEQRERRAKHRRELQEAADSMREMRKAIRETRLWPSPQMRRLREYYEAKEAMVAVSHPLGPVPKPSWTIADDGEFERFLQRYYVDAFIR